MNSAIVMLGSNTNGFENLERAVDALSVSFNVIRRSSTLTTTPCGEQYVADFQNSAVRLTSSMEVNETIEVLKEIEKQLGRTPESKKEGVIPIDLDLIVWNEKIIHRDYERFDFVRKCVDEIK